MVSPKPIPCLLLLFLLLGIAARTMAQVNCFPVSIKEYSTAGELEPAAIKALTDGTQLVVGRGTAGPSSDYDGMVTRLSATGTVLWSFRIGGAQDDAFTGITPLGDGSFLLSGTTASFGYPEGKPWLVHIDNTGATLASMQLGGTLPGPGRIKSVQQYTDGDIIGTFNDNDSTAASNPVIFKMGLDGTLRWAHLFDNGDNDSFTSVAFAGNTIYAGGFYTAGSKHAVIVQVNAGDGSLIASKNIWRDDNTYQEEITGLEVANNIISYGLWDTKDLSPFGYINGLVLVQTDLSDNPLFSLYVDQNIDGSLLVPHRTPDLGFFVVKSQRSLDGPPRVVKINHYGQADWGNLFAPYYQDQTNYAFDLTPDGGCISAGFYNTYTSGNMNLMNIMRMDAAGNTGGCTTPGNVFFTDTLGSQSQPFSWNNNAGLSISVDPAVAPVSASSLTTLNTLCEASICTDRTPLPPGCGKTYRIEYSSGKPSIFRDVIPTTDGGRIAVGTLQNDALAVKFNTNGDIAWSKTYEEFFHGMVFTRIIRTPDNNFLVFANSYMTLNHGAYGDVNMVKMDNSGNVIWSREIMQGYEYMQVADVTPAPDNGFVIVFNDAYGSGGTYTFVARYDANANMVWKKQLLHNPGTPIYRSATCGPDAVYLAYDNLYIYNLGKFGVDKLDLATGSQVWSNSYNDASATSVWLNKICTINDTVYTFLTRSVSTGFFSSDQNTLVARIDRQGNLFQSFYLTDYNLVPVQTYNYYDVAPPIVTLTPSFDFVMSNRVVNGTDTMLNITRFGQNGVKKWSRNFSGISSYTPYNIHSQGTGFIITGTVTTPVNGNNFTNGFLLKVDSNGQILPNATGDCAQENSTPSLSPAVSVGGASSNIAGVADWQYFSTPPVTVAGQTADMDATARCQVISNCGLVGFRQKGTGCSLSDTLVYYLQDAASCDAAATWSYDPSFLHPIGINGDSIQLMPLRTGQSDVTATIVANCSLSIKTLPAAVLVSAKNVTLGNDTILCKGGSIQLTPGNGYASYRWNDASTGSVLQVSAPGKYYVDVTDNCGGTGSDTVIVTLADSLFHLTGDSISCNNGSVSLQADPGYSDYTWSPAAGLQASGNTAVVTPGSTTLYQVSAKNATGCTVTAVRQVAALSSPAIYLGKDSSICTGDSLVLDAGPSFGHYRWSTGDTTSTLAIYKPGVFSIDATAANGCQSRDTFQLISLYKDPVPELDHNPVLCEGSPRVLQPADKYRYSDYLWSDGSTGPTLTIGLPGVYWLAVQDANGCRGSDTTRITSVAPPPSRFLPADTTICQYGKQTITPLLSFVTYNWSDLSTGPSLTISQQGLYWLQVEDEHECVGKDSIEVTGKQCIVGLYVPNAFTPDASGHNDVFRPLLYGNVSSFRFEVYNRYGTRVFETSDLGQGWDGKTGGTPAPSGTFVWYCQYQLGGQPMKMEKGTVILIR